MVIDASVITTGMMVAALIFLLLLVSNLGITNGMSNVNVFGHGLIIIHNDDPGRRVIVHTYFLSVDRNLRTIFESLTVHLVNKEDNL